jgi:hypothetical protein
VSSSLLIFIPSSLFLATTTTNECSLTYRVTELSSYQWCESEVILMANVIGGSTNRTITANEGTPVLIQMGSVGIDGNRYVTTLYFYFQCSAFFHMMRINRLTVTVESLPWRGTLYHPMFGNDENGEAILSYDTLVWSTSLLTPVQIGDHVCNIFPFFSSLFL